MIINSRTLLMLSLLWYTPGDVEHNSHDIPTEHCYVVCTNSECQIFLASTPVNDGISSANFFHDSIQLPVAQVQNSGRWNPSEHQLCVKKGCLLSQHAYHRVWLDRFLEGIQCFGLNYKKISQKVGSQTRYAHNFCPNDGGFKQKCFKPDCTQGEDTVCQTDQIPLLELVTSTSQGAESL